MRHETRRRRAIPQRPAATALMVARGQVSGRPAVTPLQMAFCGYVMFNLKIRIFVQALVPRSLILSFNGRIQRSNKNFTAAKKHLVISLSRWLQ